VIDDAKTYDLAPSEWRPTSLVSSPGTILSEVEPERETRSGPTSLFDLEMGYFSIIG
jgi:hypothetical protein